MTSTVTPSNQVISIDPVTGKLFDFDVSDSRYYFSRTMNNLLRVFGTDVIIDGLEITDLEYNKLTNVISCALSSGKLVIDTTLLEFPSPILLDINLNIYGDVGYILIVANFQFTESLYENKCKFKMVYMNQDKVLTNPPIDVNMDRIILGVLNYNQLNQTTSINNTITTLLLEKTYEIRPTSEIHKSLKNYVRLLFK